ncbi:hypothetical protein DUNSADRAFT_10999, partial [Dunaliella salina]
MAPHPGNAVLDLICSPEVVCCAKDSYGAVVATSQCLQHSVFLLVTLILIFCITFVKHHKTIVPGCNILCNWYCKLLSSKGGHGMSEEVLRKILISSFSHSAGPPMLGRTRLPLPLERYINRHFNRYGRGLHALFFFGDHVVIDSKVPGAVQGHQLEADYQDWRESHAKQCAGQEDKFPYRCYIRKRHDFRMLGNRGQSGETCVKISRLRPEILSLLCNREVQKFLQKQIASAYYMHLHGFEKPLFERLPSWVRQSSICPRPTVTIKMLDMRMGRDVNTEPLQDDNEAKPPILKMAATRALLYNKHRHMKPFVLCARFEPKELLGKAATGEGLALDAEEQERTKRLAARGSANAIALEEDAILQQQQQE